MNTQEQIEQLEKQLSELKEKARIEREEAQKKYNAERDSDFRALEKQVNDFNQKYDEHIGISFNKDSSLGKSIWEGFFPWL